MSVNKHESERENIKICEHLLISGFHRYARLPANLLYHKDMSYISSENAEEEACEKEETL